MKTEALLRASALLVSAFLLIACDVKYDVVTFNAVSTMPAATTPIPEIAIDTNVTGGMMGGAVKSNKPYAIRAHYMDYTFTFASAEFTKVAVTYADGTNEPGAAELKLPMNFQGRPYESHNSMAGGAVVVNKSRIIQAEFPGVITRDEPFALVIEGKFTKDNGTSIPFKLEKKYDISRNRAKQSWVDFVSDC